MDIIFSEKLQKALDPLNIRLTENQAEAFCRFYEDLVEKNKVMNLTAITEMQDVITKHFADSLALIRAVTDLGSGNRIIMDLGTGAGFPGIPLAIAFPNLDLVLADSLNKRILFIKEECGKLGMENVTAIHGRAEDLARKPEYREKFDLCVSRAVANLSTLSEYCLPFVKEGGYFIPYKSGEIRQEAENARTALKLLGGTLEKEIRFSLPEEEGERTLLKIRKTGLTPKKFPRKAGLPSKEPLSERK